MLMLIMRFSNVPKKKRKEENNIFFLYNYICIACVPCHDSLSLCVFVRVIPFYISVSHAKKKPNKKQKKLTIDFFSLHALFSEIREFALSPVSPLSLPPLPHQLECL